MTDAAFVARNKSIRLMERAWNEPPEAHFAESFDFLRCEAMIAAAFEEYEQKLEIAREALKEGQMSGWQYRTRDLDEENDPQQR